MKFFMKSLNRNKCVTMALKLNPTAGADNLLHNCIGIQPGDTLLIIGEEHGIGYYDDYVCDVVAAQAQKLGVTTQTLRVPNVDGPNDVPDAVVTAMQHVDHTVFFARLGDQIRFTETHGKSSKTMCYALNLEYLGSEFARTSWKLYKEIHDQLLTAILAAKNYHITCPLGTDLKGQVPPHKEEAANDGALTDFTIKVFPVVIYPPLNCVEISGQLMLDRFLMSTSINSFENSVVPLKQPVIAHIERSRIVEFEGEPGLVKQVKQQYQRVGEWTGGDPFAVNSWHAGMYPKTFYSDDPHENIQRWGDLAFASPRYLHFHTCGTAPGNIATATFDASITFDDEVFWDNGRLVFLDRPDIQALLSQYPDTIDAYEMRWDIGLW